MLSEILDRERILFDAHFSNKDEAIIALVDTLKGAPGVKNLEEIKKSVLEREKILSTGVGNGFAIPHAKTNAVEGFLLAVAKLAEPIDFNSHDGKPVRLIFLLVGKENMVSEHIKMLSRISRLINNDEFREKLFKSTSAEELYELLKEEEKKYFS
jgi:fructose-specific phosphotransferase system IIA component